MIFTIHFVEGHLTPPRVYTPDLRTLHPDPRELQSSPEPPLLFEQTEAQRNTVSTAIQLLVIDSELYQL